MRQPYTLKHDWFSSHARIAQLIRARAARQDIRPYPVLDIGAAGGFLRHWLPSPQYYLMGVDIDRDYVNRARTVYDEAHWADISSEIAFPLHRQPLTVVLGDILEHLPDPARVLSALLAVYSDAQIQVIISLPNIAHLYVRLNLLFGRFDYADRGILDRTHMRFFTLRTARELLTVCGLEIITTDVTPLPLPLISQSFGEGRVLYPLHVVSALLARQFKTLLAYQFIFEGYHEG